MNFLQTLLGLGQNVEHALTGSHASGPVAAPIVDHTPVPYAAHQYQPMQHVPTLPQYQPAGYASQNALQQLANIGQPRLRGSESTGGYVMGLQVGQPARNYYPGTPDGALLGVSSGQIPQGNDYNPGYISLQNSGYGGGNPQMGAFQDQPGQLSAPQYNNPQQQFGPY